MFEKMQLECQAQLLAMDRKQDLKKIEALQQKMSEQDEKHEKELRVIQVKSAKLVSGLLPRRAQSNDLDQDQDHEARDQQEQGPAGEEAGEAKATLQCDNVAVQEQVLAILGKLYADELSEDQAVVQLATLNCSIQLSSFATEAQPTADSAQGPASTTSLPTPSVAVGSSPFTTAGSQGKAGWGFSTQFVMDDPHKLQRLIARANKGSSELQIGGLHGFGDSQRGQPPAPSSPAHQMGNAANVMSRHFMTLSQQVVGGLEQLGHGSWDLVGAPGSKPNSAAGSERGAATASQPAGRTAKPPVHRPVSIRSGSRPSTLAVSTSSDDTRAGEQRKAPTILPLPTLNLKGIVSAAAASPQSPPSAPHTSFTGAGSRDHDYSDDFISMSMDLKVLTK